MTDSKDRLIELLKQVNFDFSEECVACLEDGYKATPMLEEFFADHLIAEGVIVPPCKVGDKVYKITRNKVKECEVVFVGISADERCSHFNFVENYADGTFKQSYSMVFEVIGKTVFLTKEEAEAKLKEREG